LCKLETAISLEFGRRFSLLSGNQPDVRLARDHATTKIKQDGIEGWERINFDSHGFVLISFERVLLRMNDGGGK